MTTLSNAPTYPAGVITQYHVRQQIRASQEFKNLNMDWHRSTFGWWQTLGRCMLTIRQHRPQTFAEWVEVYFTYCKDWEAIQALGERWAAISGLSVQVATAHCIIHGIDETWEGFAGELAAEKLMTEFHDLAGETVHEATDDEDFNYAVDFIIKDGDRIVQAIQVKPASFFHSDRIQKERNRYKRLNNKFTEHTGAPVYYVNCDEAKNGILKYIPLADVR